MDNKKTEQKKCKKIPIIVSLKKRYADMQTKRVAYLIVKHHQILK
jgi:hypothetical protein